MPTNCIVGVSNKLKHQCVYSFTTRCSHASKQEDTILVPKYATCSIILSNGRKNRQWIHFTFCCIVFLVECKLTHTLFRETNNHKPFLHSCIYIYFHTQKNRQTFSNLKLLSQVYSTFNGHPPIWIGHQSITGH